MTDPTLTHMPDDDAPDAVVQEQLHQQRLSRVRIQRLLARRNDLRRSATHATVMAIAAWVLAAQCALLAMRAHPLWWWGAALLVVLGLWLTRLSRRRQALADATRITPSASLPPDP